MAWASARLAPQIVTAGGLLQRTASNRPRVAPEELSAKAVGAEQAVFVKTVTLPRAHEIGLGRAFGGGVEPRYFLLGPDRAKVEQGMFIGDAAEDLFGRDALRPADADEIVFPVGDALE